jgi:hypothetical protein
VNEEYSFGKNGRSWWKLPLGALAIAGIGALVYYFRRAPKPKPMPMPISPNPSEPFFGWVFVEKKSVCEQAD